LSKQPPKHLKETRSNRAGFCQQRADKAARLPLHSLARLYARRAEAVVLVSGALPLAALTPEYLAKKNEDHHFGKSVWRPSKVLDALAVPM